MKMNKVLRFLLPVTLIVNEQNALFPLGSRASQITSVCPISNRLIDSTLHDTSGFTLELSVPCGLVQPATAVDKPDVVAFVWFEGQETSIGASVSA